MENDSPYVTSFRRRSRANSRSPSHEDRQSRRICLCKKIPDLLLRNHKAKAQVRHTTRRDGATHFHKRFQTPGFTMTTNAGIWIDHHKAVVVLLTDRVETTEIIFADAKPRKRPAIEATTAMGILSTTSSQKTIASVRS